MGLFLNFRGEKMNAFEIIVFIVGILGVFSKIHIKTNVKGTFISFIEIFGMIIIKLAFIAMVTLPIYFNFWKNS